MLTGEHREIERGRIVSGNWPHYPILPVKRDVRDEGGWPEMGVIAWHEGIESGPIKVYLCNLFDLAARATDEKLHDRDKPVTYAEVLEGVPTKDYLSLEEFFDAGWRGD